MAAKKKPINGEFNWIQMGTDFLNKRMKSGQLQREVAKEAGISHSSVFRAESAKTLDIHTLAKVCNWIGVNIQKYL